MFRVRKRKDFSSSYCSIISIVGVVGYHYPSQLFLVVVSGMLVKLILDRVCGNGIIHMIGMFYDTIMSMVWYSGQILTGGTGYTPCGQTSIKRRNGGM